MLEYKCKLEGVVTIVTEESYTSKCSFMDNEHIKKHANYVGKRIVIVGNTDEPSIWENPRHILDLQLSKTFKNKFEVKLNIRDALAQNLIFYQDLNKNGKFDKSSLTDNKEFNHSNNSDNVMVNTKLAPTISLSLSYKFK
jgi:predicted oxidoreductase (fatty acid repression mutant protein)